MPRPPSLSKTIAPIGTGAVARAGTRGPGGVGYRMQQISPVVTRIVGRSYIGTVTTAGKIAANAQGVVQGMANTIGLMFDINPVLLNDRVSVVASTFDKYVYQGVRFTYVPQCPTTTAGSVALVFERDPSQAAANTQSPQFLSEVMSYENPVLTPAWQETSTAYRRDPKELKTWFIGSPDASLTPRETSQGHLICYLSNATGQYGSTVSQGYGFIVMDYVLDLVSPNIMPNKLTSNSVTLGVGQFQDYNGSVPGSSYMTQFTGIRPAAGFVGQAPWLTYLPSGATYNPFFTCAPAPGLNWLTQSSDMQPGAIGSITINGATSDGLSVVLPQFYKVASGSGTVGTGSFVTTVTFRQGQHIYFCVHNVYTGEENGTAVSARCVTFHSSLAGAIAASGTAVSAQYNTVTSAIVNIANSDCLYLVALDVNGLTATVNVGGWVRTISSGAQYTSTDNA